jgi:glyoxylase-like metal-dependent hydrolase (beta-lactamase superfamily II)
MDGGAMFGVVPKALWQKHAPADPENRIRMATNCLLIETAGRRILVDTGCGSKAPDKVRSILRLDGGTPLLLSLANVGLAPDDIDTVILTHLHFDHAGGATSYGDGGRIVPTFPRARYVIQEMEWDDATGRLPELKGAYFPKDFEPLEDTDCVDLVDDLAEIAPGVAVRRVVGHTRGMQVVELSANGRKAIYLADLCPMVPHLRVFWTMAYDQFPLDTRRNKLVELERIVNEGTLALFDHDPHTAAAWIRRDPKDGFAVAQTVKLPLDLGEVTGPSRGI